MNIIIKNPWIDLPSQKPFILLEDKKILDQRSNNHGLRFDTLPDPFIGSPTKAKVIFLNLNPGFSERDLQDHQKPEFARERRKNLTHEADPPFYILNKDFEDTSGYEWWYKRLRRVIEECGRDNVCKKVMVLEYFSYHSISYRDIGTILPSQEYSFYLLKQVVQSEKMIVVMRGLRYWTQQVPELENYPYIRLNNPRSPYVSENNMPSGSFQKLVELINHGRERSQKRRRGV